jgi:SAM-dependent methyltransferase
MMDACLASYPGVNGRVGDIRDLSGFADGSFGAIVAAFNLLDVLNDAERRGALVDLRRMLVPGGLLVFSTHNRDARLDRPVDWLRYGPIAVAKLAVRTPRWLPNRRRLTAYEREEVGYAIRNDSAHDYGGLHYYITRNDQDRQLAEAGFTLVECLDLNGLTVGPGDRSTSSELHFVAR